MIRYLFTSYKASIQQGVSNEFVFFLQLKQHFKEGFVPCKNYLTAINRKIPYSKGQISHLFRRLQSLGWIELWQKGDFKWRFVFRSLNSVYRKLGFRFKKQNNYYRFKLINISSKNKKQIKAVVQQCELEKNRKNQLFYEIKRINAKIDYHTNRLNQGHDVKKREERLTSLRKELSEIEPMFSQTDESKTLNPSLIRSKISLKKISSLLGYRAASTALNINKVAEKDNLYSVTRGLIKIAEKVPFMNYLFGIKVQEPLSFWKFGSVYKRSCNVYHLNFQTQSEIVS